MADSGDTFSRLHLGRELDGTGRVVRLRLASVDSYWDIGSWNVAERRNVYQSVLSGPTCVAGYPEHRAHTRLFLAKKLWIPSMTHFNRVPHLFQNLELFGEATYKIHQNSQQIVFLCKDFLFCELVNLPVYPCRGLAQKFWDPQIGVILLFCIPSGNQTWLA